jgi:hypothetical protein
VCGGVTLHRCLCWLNVSHTGLERRLVHWSPPVSSV